jgi:hypothetical protein
MPLDSALTRSARGDMLKVSGFMKLQIPLFRFANPGLKARTTRSLRGPRKAVVMFTT